MQHIQLSVLVQYHPTEDELGVMDRENLTRGKEKKQNTAAKRVQFYNRRSVIGICHSQQKSEVTHIHQIMTARKPVMHESKNNSDVGRDDKGSVFLHSP